MRADGLRESPPLRQFCAEKILIYASSGLSTCEWRTFRARARGWRAVLRGRGVDPIETEERGWCGCDLAQGFTLACRRSGPARPSR